MKIISKLLLTGVFFVTLCGVFATPSWAHFYDNETSQNVQAATGTLDAGFEKTPGALDFKVENLGSLDFEYSFGYSYGSGDESVCNQASLSLFKDSLGGENVYMGPLKDFTGFTPKLLAAEPSGNSHWYFALLSVPLGVAGECFFNFNLTAWQEGLIYPNGFIDDESVSLSVSGGAVSLPSVVLNEFVPNPAGNDNAPRPGGEYVELYNKSASEFDLAGWYLYDVNDTHELPVTSTNSESHSHDGSLLNSNTTVIPAEGFLLVYRNGDGDFELNNTGGDTVRLYNGAIGGVGVILIDSYAYDITAGEDKSFARIPDGTGAWVDPVPTPGGPNRLEEEPQPEPEPEPEPEGGVEPVIVPLPETPEASPSAQPAPEAILEDEAI